MKLKMTYILIWLLLASQGMEAQKTDATLTFKNGQVSKGFAEIKGRHYVKFRQSKEIKPEKIHFSELEKVAIEFEEGTTTYVYLPKKGKKKSKIYKRLYQGDVSLYMWNTGGSNVGYNAAAPGTMGGNRVVGSSFYWETYFIKRKQDDGLTLFFGTSGYVRGYRRAVRKFFNDCPELLEKVKNKEFKRKHVIETIEFYNQNCVKKY